MFYYKFQCAGHATQRHFGRRRRVDLFEIEPGVSKHITFHLVTFINLVDLLYKYHLNFETLHCPSHNFCLLFVSLFCCCCCVYSLAIIPSDSYSHPLHTFYIWWWIGKSVKSEVIKVVIHQNYSTSLHFMQKYFGTAWQPTTRHGHINQKKMCRYLLNTNDNLCPVWFFSIACIIQSLSRPFHNEKEFFLLSLSLSIFLFVELNRYPLFISFSLPFILCQPQKDAHPIMAHWFQWNANVENKY